MSKAEVLQCLAVFIRDEGCGGGGVCEAGSCVTQAVQAGRQTGCTGACLPACLPGRGQLVPEPVWVALLLLLAPSTRPSRPPNPHTGLFLGFAMSSSGRTLISIVAWLCPAREWSYCGHGWSCCWGDDPLDTASSTWVVE